MQKQEFRRPASGVIKILDEWFLKYGLAYLKSREGAIGVARKEGAFGMENYLEAISSEHYIHLLSIIEFRFSRSERWKKKERQFVKRTN